ncbi:hypothetical protein [Paraburkholderia fynbosensis]|uniref:Uncharacterized protein n=1 Tax=Paraburkholderia fynbosensis TaxID=1200993 RepID=A0A6J5GVY2_9BURK|nr:hypothetical protein [Paraburkholderia fynbosensis]CAB3807251.1 hypothetical protein LMG27177_06291 [Paraburkholderia fynbosensis]
MHKKSMDHGRSDIGELERAVNTLVHRPGLIRREYWRSEVERPLGRTDITARDRQRLLALHDLLGHVMEEGCAHPN